MLRRFVSLLNSPFPDRKDVLGHIRETFLIALFIAFFLYSFNPFGFQNLDVGRLYASISFGLVTFFCSVSFDLFLRFVVKLRTDVPTWTLWKWLFTMAMAVAWIALGNYATLMLLQPHPFRVEILINMLIDTYLVAFMPVLAMGMALQLRAERYNQSEALTLNEKRSSDPGNKVDSKITAGAAGSKADLSSSNTRIVTFEINANENLTLPINRILLIEAMQNYLTVHHLSVSQGPSRDLQPVPKSLNQVPERAQKTVVRCTLANAESMLVDSRICRCHRSYMVNLDEVISVNGNAQGLKLGLNHIHDLTVPVSRRFIPAIKNALSNAD